MLEYQELDDVFKHNIFPYMKIREIINLCSTNINLSYIYNNIKTWEYLIKRDFNIISDLYDIETYKKHHNYKIIQNNMRQIFEHSEPRQIYNMNIFDTYIYNYDNYVPIYIIIPSSKYNIKDSYCYILQDYDSQKTNYLCESKLEEYSSQDYENYSHIYSVFEYQLDFYNNILNIIQEYDNINYKNDSDEEYSIQEYDSINYKNNSDEECSIQEYHNINYKNNSDEECSIQEYNIKEKYNDLIVYLNINKYNWKLSEGDIYQNHEIIENIEIFDPYDYNIIISAKNITDPIFKFLSTNGIINIEIQDTFQNTYQYDSSTTITEKSCNYYQDIINLILYLKSQIQYLPMKYVLKSISKIETIFHNEFDQFI